MLKQGLIRFTLLGVSFLCLFSLTKAQTTANASIDTQSIENLIQSQISKQTFVGSSIAVIHNGKLVYNKGFGKSSLEKQTPVTQTTRFDIASVSKQFTCAAILLLAEEGKLSINDKVAKYFPNVTGANNATLLDLMNNVAGYEDFYPLSYLERRMLKPTTADEIIKIHATRPLEFEPGTQWSYSNTNFTILSRIVEKVSGKTFPVFLEQKFFKPLGMKDTVLMPRKRDERYAIGYSSFALSEPKPSQIQGENWSAGSGGIHTTAIDLSKWSLALIDGKVLKPESFKLMATRRKLKDGSVTDYGCGLEIQTIQGDTVLTHGGSATGFLARNIMIPSTRSVIVVLTNTDYVLPGSILYGKLTPLMVTKQPVDENTAKNKKVTTVQKAPEVKGISAGEAAKQIFAQMQNAKLDRTILSEEFSHFLTSTKLNEAAARLKPFGEPIEVKVLGRGNRTGLEVSNLELTFATGKLMATMFRSVDGKIHEFFIRK